MGFFDFVSDAWNTIKSGGKKLFSTVKDTIQKSIHTAHEAVKTVYNDVKSVVPTVYKDIKGAYSWVGHTAAGLANKGLNTLEWPLIIFGGVLAAGLAFKL